MSLNIQRSPSLRPVLKTVPNLNNSSILNQLLDRRPAGSSTITFESLTIGNVPINNTVIQQLSPTTGIVEGVASPEKALVLNFNRNITGINKIYVNSLYINNVLLNPSIFAGSSVAVSTDDANRPELSNINMGIASANKALVLDDRRSIKGLNKVSTEIVESGSILYANSRNNVIQMNNIDYFDRVYNKNNNHIMDSIFSSSLDMGNLNNSPHSNDSYINRELLISDCYSPLLDIYVAVFNDNSFAYSYNGWEWTRSASFTTIRQVIWIDHIATFAGVGGNELYTSQDGINWTSRTISNFTLNCICYGEDLNMFVIGGTQTLFSTSLTGEWQIADCNIAITNICYVDGSKRFVGVTTNSIFSMVTSVDGKNWTTQIINNANTAILSIVYEKTKNILIVITSFNATPREARCGYYSKDGGFTFKPMYNATTSSLLLRLIKYIPDYAVFIGVCTSINQRSTDLAYSHDGITWRGFNHGATNNNSQLYSIVYNKKQRIVYFRNSPNDVSFISFRKLRLTPYSTSFGSINTRDTNIISFHSNDNKMLNIGSQTGKLINFSNINTNAYTVDIFNERLTISGKNVNINAPILVINNNFIETINLQYLALQDLNPSTFRNYYSLDQRKKNSYIINTNNSNNLTVHGYLNVNNLTINGNTFNVSNNKDEFKNNSIGIANANKFIISKYGGELNGINTISQQRIKIENNILTSSKTTQAIVDLGKKAEICMDSRYTTNPFGSGVHSGSGSEAIVLTDFLGATTTADRIYYAKETGLLFCVRTNLIRYPSVDTENFTFSEDTSARVGGFTSINQFNYIKELNAYYIASALGMFMSTDGYTWKLCNTEEPNIAFRNFAFSPSLNTMIVSTDSSSYISKDSFNFRRFGDLKGTFPLNAVLWVEEWSMFVGILRTNTATRRQYTYSLDGNIWETAEFNDETIIKSTQANAPTSIVYSPKLNICLALGANMNIRYTYNGRIWFNYNVESGVTFNNIQWIPELEVFIASSASTATALLYYSYNGFDWNGLRAPLTINTTTYAGAVGQWVYINKLGCLANFSTTTTAGLILLKSSFIKNATLNHTSVVAEPNTNLSIDIINNRVGFGVQNPQFSLQLGEDLAFKPTSSTWSTSSDERLKEEIQTANTTTCYNNIKNLKLKKFKWKDDIYKEKSLSNKEQLGWIAQDVEQVIPKAVQRKNMFGIGDCRTLNNDQIIANMFGAIKELIKIDDELEEYFE